MSWSKFSRSIRRLLEEPQLLCISRCGTEAAWTNFCNPGSEAATPGAPPPTITATSTPRAMYAPARKASTSVLSGRSAALYSLMFSTDATTSSGRLKLLATFTPALRGAPAVMPGAFVGCPCPTTAGFSRSAVRPEMVIGARGVMGSGVMGMGVADMVVLRVEKVRQRQRRTGSHYRKQPERRTEQLSPPETGERWSRFCACCASMR